MNFAAILSLPATKCPTCHGTQLRPSRWITGDGALRPLVLSPYRCIACNTRFFKPSRNFIMLLGGIALFGMVVVSIVSITYWIHRGGEKEQSGFSPLRGAAVKDGAAQPLAPALRAVSADAQMQFELGMRYLSGEGAPRNHAEGLKWLEMAASGGHPVASYDLGEIYRGGVGVQSNESLAFHWYDQAARENHPDAQYQIAVMLREGKVVPMDLAKSYAWATIGAIQGHIGAVTLRENLKHVMTLQQIQDGQRAVDAWTAATEKARVAAGNAARNPVAR